MTTADVTTASRFAAQWLGKLLHLRAMLCKDPSNREAWRWQLRIKILSYFLSRYGNDPTLDRRIAPIASPRSSGYNRIRRPTTGIRTRDDIRPFLLSIAEANVRRDSMLNPPIG